jgi:hypothetical protein
MNLIQLIRNAQGSNASVVAESGPLSDWAMGSADYEIVR